MAGVPCWARHGKGRGVTPISQRDMVARLRVNCRSVAEGVVVRAVLHPCGLSVTETVRDGGKVDRGHYTVTHSASGLALPMHGTLGQCWSYIGMVMSWADWTQSKQQLGKIEGLKQRAGLATGRIKRRAG